MTKTILKRAYAIFVALCLVVASCFAILPQKAHSASAETVVVPDEPLPSYDGFYTVPLKTYNQITVYEDSACSPVPLALAFDNYMVNLYMTYDGYVEPLSETVSNSTIFTYNVVEYPSGYAFTVDLPFYVLFGTFRDSYYAWSCKLSMYTGSFAFKNMTEEEYRQYIPYRMREYYIVHTYNDIPYMLLDYYVDYVHYSAVTADGVDTSNLVTGVGISIRMPLLFYAQNGITSFASLNYNVLNDVPTTKNNAYTDYNLYAITYTDGYADETFNYVLGYTFGYADGYNVGIGLRDTYWYNQGYNTGYFDALDRLDDLTFKGLLTSVIDVPINALRSVLSFDLLGIDMATLAFSLLTLCIILSIVRLII